MNGFEEHARSAASDAAGSADHLPIPDLDGRPSAGARLLLTVAAVAAITLAGFGVLRSGEKTTTIERTDLVDEPSETDDEASTAGTVQHFTIPVAPDAQLIAMESPASGRFPDSSLSLYGAGSGDDPIAEGFILVAGEASEGIGGQLEGDERFRVRGVDAVRMDDDLSPTFESIEWFEPRGPKIQLGSDVLELSDLIALAETLVIDGIDVVIPNPPRGMTLLIDRLPTDELPLPGSSWGVAVDDPSGSYSLSGARSVENGLLFLRAGLDLHDPVTVRNTTGWTTIDGEFPALVWEEGGTTLILAADSSADLLDIAEQIVPISEEQWAQLVAESPDPSEFGEPGDSEQFPAGDTFEAAAEMLTAGSVRVGSDEIHWSHYRSTDAGVCLEVRTPDGGGSGQCGGDPAEPASLRFQWSRGGTVDTVHGTVAGDVSQLSLQTDRTTNDLMLTPMTTGAVAFAALLEPGEIPLRLTALDNTDRELWSAAAPNPPRFGYSIDEETRFGAISGISASGYELVGDTLVEWRLFSTDQGTPCFEFVRGDLVVDCPGPDSPDAIGGIQGERLNVTPILTDDVVSVGGRVSGEISRVVIETGLRTIDTILRPTYDDSGDALFGLVLQPNESLASVTAIASSGEVVERWTTAPAPTYPTRSE